MKRSGRATVVVAALLAACMLISSRASAQEILLEGPLAGAPAVRKMLHLREGRVYFGPDLSITILDDYRQHILMGLKVGYDFLDWMGVSAKGQFALGWNTPLTNHIIDNQNQGLRPTSSNFPSYTGDIESQIGKLQWFTAIQANFIPLRGKVGLFDSVFFSLDAQLFLGLGVAGIQERASCSNAEGNNTCGTTSVPNMNTTTRVALGPTFGAAFTGYMNKWLALSLEYRATPFPWNVSGTDERGSSGFEDPARRIPNQEGGGFPDREIDSDDQIWYFNQQIGLNFVFIFPMEPEIGD